MSFHEIHRCPAHLVDGALFQEDDEAAAGVDGGGGVDLLHDDEVELTEVPLGAEGPEDVSKPVVDVEQVQHGVQGQLARGEGVEAEGEGELDREDGRGLLALTWTRT